MRIDVWKRCRVSLAPARLWAITAAAACGSQDEGHAQPVPPTHDSSAEGAGTAAAQQAADACLWGAVQTSSGCVQHRHFMRPNK